MQSQLKSNSNYPEKKESKNQKQQFIPKKH